MSRPVWLDIFRVEIPMRSFEHAAASRNVSESVVTRVTWDDGRRTFGQTLPRDYVTGESVGSVVDDLANVLWPTVAGKEVGPQTALPLVSDGRRITAAACALEVALDPLWLGRADVCRRITSRVSGVLGSSLPSKTLKRLRLLWLYGLRDFKLKLGLGQEIDRENMRLVYSRLGGAIAAGRASLRVDVNGGWTSDETPHRVEQLARLGVCVVEQPTFCTAEALVELARRCCLPLMADESLVTPADASELLQCGPSVWWNIRISKNGGIGPAIDLASQAAAAGVPFVIGCMVGESGILSAAQRRLLQGCPQPRFVEGNYGKFLLAQDITQPSCRFGYGGRLGVLGGKGLGVTIDERRLGRLGTKVARLGGK